MNIELILKELQSEYGGRCTWRTAADEEISDEISKTLHDRGPAVVRAVCRSGAVIVEEMETGRYYGSDGKNAIQLKYPDDAEQYMRRCIEERIPKPHWRGRLGLAARVLLYGGNILMLPYLIYGFGMVIYVLGRVGAPLLFAAEFAELPLALLVYLTGPFLLSIPIVTLICFVICAKRFGMQKAEANACILYIIELPFVIYYFWSGLWAMFF